MIQLMMILTHREIFLLVIGSITYITLFVVTIQNSRRKILLLRQRLEKVHAIQEQQEAMSLQRIEQNRQKIAELENAGIDKHAGTIIGLWDKTIDKAENETIEENVTKETAPEIVKEPWLELQVGDRVTHKSFGPGDVMSIDEKYIFVHFPDVEKKFLYPDAFEKGYLSC